MTWSFNFHKKGKFIFLPSRFSWDTLLSKDFFLPGYVTECQPWGLVLFFYYSLLWEIENLVTCVSWIFLPSNNLQKIFIATFEYFWFWKLIFYHQIFIWCLPCFVSQHLNHWIIQLWSILRCVPLWGKTLSTFKWLPLCRTQSILILGALPLSSFQGLWWHLACYWCITWVWLFVAMVYAFTILPKGILCLWLILFPVLTMDMQSYNLEVPSCVHCSTFSILLLINVVTLVLVYWVHIL